MRLTAETYIKYNTGKYKTPPNESIMRKKIMYPTVTRVAHERACCEQKGILMSNFPRKGRWKMCNHNQNCPYNQWNTKKVNKLIPWFSMVDSIKGKSTRTILETNRSVEHDCDKHSSGCLRHQKASARFWRSKDCRHRNGCVFISLLEGGYSISNWYFVNFVRST